MRQFEYTGQLRGGSAIAGTLESDSLIDARNRLDEMGVSVNSLVEAARMPVRRPLSGDDFQFFNEQLASMAKSEMALEPGLRMLARDVGSRRLRRVCNEMADDVARGSPLPKAIERHGSAFPPLYAQVVEAGMTSGQLGATLYNLNAHLRLLGQTRRAIWEVAGYPLIVLVLGGSILTLFLTYIVPQMEAIFTDFGTQLPAVTLLIMGLAHAWPWLLVGAAVLGVAVVMISIALRTTPGGLRVREHVLLAIPGVGEVYRSGILARFTRAAALASTGGQTLPLLLRLAAGAVGSPLLMRDAAACAAAVESGGSLIEASMRTRLLPALFGHLVQTAGPRGTLTAALHDLARTYDEQAQQRLALVRMFLFPAFIFMLGSILALGAFAMLAPLVSLVNSLTGS